MGILYSFGIRIYYLLILISSSFNKKAKLWINGRKLIYKGFVKRSGAKVYWFHCSSLGEFEQGRPIIEGLREKNEDIQIVLSFYSPSGYSIRENYELADVVCYLPLDTSRNAKKFLAHYQPDVAVFVKYEFWHHIIKQVYKQNIPIYLIAAIFRDKQLFFKWYGSFFRKILFRFKTIFVQNKSSFELLNKIGIKNAILSGDTRFDRVHKLASNPMELPLIKKFKDEKLLLICGSTWPADEEILFNFINSCVKDIKFIIAPHDVSEKHIGYIEKMIQIPYIKYSEAKDDEQLSKKLLLIDSIGILSSIYQFGDIAYIGGGFGSGIHNIQEAATYGMPIVFGPKYQKFQEAIDLIELGVAQSVIDKIELSMVFRELIEGNSLRATLSEKAYAYVCENIGTSEQILEALHT